MLKFLKKVIPDTHPLRLLFHKLKAVMAALMYWFPSDKMVVIGVTGTNGKTTTVNLITNVLEAAGHKVGMMSTINFQVGSERWTNTTKQTTASPFVIQKLLRRMVRTGCKYVVLEVSSHAVTQSRIYGITFDVAVVTNVTSDHIEYHGSFEAYLNAKTTFFKKVSEGKRKVGIEKVMVLNADDEYLNYFDQFVADRKLTYGLNMATIYAAEIEKTAQGSKFNLRVPNNKIALNLSLPGEFNIYNALASASVGIALGVPLEAIKKGLEGSKSVPGRMEHVDVGQDFSVVVDYAHAADSLEGLLSLYRSLTPGKLFVVFGATGGGRDKAKRPKMGAVANEYADYVIVTDDDPYEEDEWKIIEEVSQGVARKEGDNFWKIPDRREAIRLALTLAREGDTVVVAGKGAEEVMMLRGKRVPYNDKRVITEILGRDVKLELGTTLL